MKIKIFILTLISFIINSSVIFGLTADEIMKKVDQRDTGNSAILPML